MRQPKQFLLFQFFVSCACGSADEEEPFSPFLSYAGLKTCAGGCHFSHWCAALFECLTPSPAEEGVSKPRQLSSFSPAVPCCLRCLGKRQLLPPLSLSLLEPEAWFKKQRSTEQVRLELTAVTSVYGGQT